MPGIAELALGAAPIAGGALLGAAAGNIKPPDVRGLISKDLDLLARIPPEQEERRARLQRSIDQRIDGLIDATDKSRQLREAASSYTGLGGWRDVMVLLATVLFTIIWWHVEHSRSNWTLMFIVLIGLNIVVAGYVVRDVRNAFRRRLPGGSGAHSSTS
ncbi:Uncharacterised protein [Mycolicibacterium vanbaalenii]|uniref:Transmembrane protein n=1 Tax=Mycolicibacterium vanbaalenii TaxID=110539 RepID=A0A5S9P3U8_MYCVN|nr:hypothetical protein [Mycolicibacterium vanbaalenii]CAA0097976.1 Uncharacterised protein [Mycolicibacterium vanbaalenii]